MKRLAPLLALALSACVSVEGFDPSGDQAAISGAWEIDGIAPTQSSCRSLGAARVRATFLDDRRPVTHSGLFFQCHVGSFSTVGNGGAVIGAGRWTVRLDALDDNGDLLAAGTPTDVTIEEGMYQPDGGTPLIVVDTANFFSATLSTTYRIQGQDPTQERCDAAGVATVGFVFDDLGGGAVTTVDPAPCALGVLGTRILPGHTYTVRVSAFDAAGATVFERTFDPFAVTTGLHTELDTSGPIDLRP